MGTVFESYSLYSNLWRVQLMETSKMKQAMHENALVYIDINSETIGKRSGDVVPICWTAVAAGNRDTQLHAWTAAILATHYHHFVFTFNHEPMWSSPQRPNCGPKYDNPRHTRLPTTTSAICSSPTGSTRRGRT